VPFDHEAALRLLPYLRRQRLQGAAGIGPQRGRIILEEDAVRRGGDVRANLVVRRLAGIGPLPQVRARRRLRLLTSASKPATPTDMISERNAQEPLGASCREFMTIPS
jgi:hypothetical protein